MVSSHVVDAKDQINHLEGPGQSELSFSFDSSMIQMILESIQVF